MVAPGEAFFAPNETVPAGSRTSRIIGHGASALRPAVETMFIAQAGRRNSTSVLRPSFRMGGPGAGGRNVPYRTGMSPLIWLSRGGAAAGYARSAWRQWSIRWVM